MKICNVILCLNAGGAENAATIISNYLCKKHKLSFLLFVKRKNWPVFYKLNKKIKIKDLDLYKKSVNIFSAISSNFKRILIIRKNIKKQNPDLVIAHCSREIVLTFLACFFMKKKIIGYIHSDPKKLIKEKSKLWLIMTYVSFSLINHSIIFSRETRKQLPFLAQKKSLIIPNVSSESKYVKKDYTQKNIVMVGSLIDIKNHEFVIYNYKKIINKFPNWKLLIIGDGPLKSHLKKIIIEEGLTKNIFLLGNKKNIFNYYKKASIFLLSSVSEGMNLSLLEAIKYGMPIISSDCSISHKKIINHNQNGYLFKLNSNNQIQKYLIKLMKNEKIRKKFGKESILLSKQFRNKNILNKWDVLLKKLDIKSS